METYEGLSYVFFHPIDTFKAVYNDYKTKLQSSRGKGEICGEVFILLFTVGSGTAIKSGSKAVDISKQATALTKVFRSIKTDLFKGTSGKITGISPHGFESILTHDGVGVSSIAIKNAVNNPIRIIFQENGRIRYIGENAEVVLDKSGNLITTWAKHEAGWRLK